EKESFAVADLRTPYGLLSYSYQVDGNKRTLEIGKMPRLPAGGIAVNWPQRPPGSQIIRSGSGRWLGDELRIGTLPFRIEFTQ
ncbi:MAG TPA: hypothetical protein VIT67_02770, partial [Povalibacter sp.]